MTSFEDALKIVLSSARLMNTERVSFDQSTHRVLAEDVYSDINMPPFHKAAVDGFACCQGDLGQAMQIVETIAAGQVPQHRVGDGTCARIMTGAMLPRGADTVVMVEQTELEDEDKVRFLSEKSARNIAYKGEDVKTGDKVLKKGTLIAPEQIAIMAAVGATHPLVYKQPRVAILSTGNELVEPHEKPPLAKIRNSNAWQLIAQVKNTFCIPNYMGIVPDTLEETDKAISQALKENDMVILTGGVSMGEYDFVPQVLKNNKVDLLFEKVAVKPGRPTVFGLTERSSVFGLPGNPVSCFINFELFAKPLLLKMMGHDFVPVERKYTLAVNFKRKKADRLEWLPVSISSNGDVIPASYHGSAHIHAISLSHGLMKIPVNTFEILKGDQVYVRPF